MVKRIIPPVVCCVGLLLSLVLDRMVPMIRTNHIWISIVGVFLIAGGLLFAAWARSLFKRRHIPIRPGDDLTVLETAGPYQLTRNPMYLGMTAISLGVSFLLGSLTALTAPLVFWAVMNFVYIPFEEEKLKVTFKSEYTDYMKKVRRWI